MKIANVIAAAAIAGSASAEVITRCKNSNKDFALTFDEGPSRNSLQVLDALDKANAKASFHITVNYFNDPVAEASVRRMHESGHVVGIRFDTQFADLRTLDDARILASLENSASAIQKVIGKKPKLVRLPVGMYDARVVKTIEGAGYVITEASLDTADYSAGSAAGILGAFQGKLNEFGTVKVPLISVQRDAIVFNNEATPQIVDLLRSKEYNLVTLDTCVGTGVAYMDGSGAGGSKSDASSLATFTGLALIGSTVLAVAFQFI